MSSEPSAAHRPPSPFSLRALVDDFVLLHEICDPWSDGELEESEDCNVLSDAFTDFCRTRGLEANTVRVGMTHAVEAMLENHYFTVLDLGVAVDFTARQFHDVKGMPLSIEEIPFPLVFLWPGDFPLPGLSATRATQVN